MTSIEEKRRQRAAFMRALYEATDGNEQQFDRPAAIAEAAGVPEDQVTPLLTYLEGEYLIEVSWTYGGPAGVQMKHPGVVEVEAALAEPDAPTQHFASINSITIVGNVTGSQIGAAGGDLMQTATFDRTQADAVQAWVEQFRAALGELDEEVRATAIVQLDSVAAEVAKPRPHPGLISGGMAALRSFAQSAVSSAGAGAGTLALAELIAHWPL